ncbi:hypothetical protein QZH41_007915 [Actinostola sp. cb2023]|nr:hypothetical protein QZH41_007915 [Actinostola sp. cb2023]
MTHKMSVVNTLLRRAKSIPSTEDQKKKEREHVRSVLTENNYPPGIIRTCERTLDHLRDGQDHNSSDNRDNETATVVLPYVKGISERVQRVPLKQHNIRVAHRPMKKLANVFPRPKDPQDKSSRTGIVYKIKCDDCDFVYYGQTERSLKTRTTEHKRAISHNYSNSKIAQHANNTGHTFDFNNTEIVASESNYHRRLFLEAWYSAHDRNAGNDYISIPDVYRAIELNTGTSTRSRSIF